MSDYPAKMSSVELSLIDTRTYSTKTKTVTTVRLRRLLEEVIKSEDLLQAAHTFQNLLCLVLSTATLKQIQTRFVYGKLNSVTLRTELKSSSTNLLPRAKQNGMLRTVW